MARKVDCPRNFSAYSSSSAKPSAVWAMGVLDETCTYCESGVTKAPPWEDWMFGMSTICLVLKSRRSTKPSRPLARSWM